MVGASVDTAAANRKFAEKHGLRMPLLCDPDYTICMAYGVAEGQGQGRARRTTFLISPGGRVERVFKGVKAKGHAAAVLEAARKIWPD